ncbi:MAG: FtsW/RodA/SpoVE family cell cycle protein, partial [Candidatus Omnitrophica bacterium]|nr:FtsW/RodA/SpoVE family cell cycle protein [Candidatus Omnitrophota bacterium]
MLILISIGIVMIYSASGTYALNRYKDSMFFLKRQTLFFILGISLFTLILFFDYRLLSNFSKPLVFLGILLLILVLIPGIGREVAGARRWFRLGYFNFQPSELANLATIIYLADYLRRKEKIIKDFLWGLLPYLLILGLVAGLVLLEPDFGNAMNLVIVGLILLFIAGARIKHILSIILLGIPLVFLLIMHTGYRKSRILAFLNPWQDPKGSGFQLIQSQIALGSGGLWGTGLGSSRQKLFYLPAAHTDFIFSIIGEELGLLGTLGVLFLFLLFLHQALKIAKNTNDRFGYFLG